MNNLPPQPISPDQAAALVELAKTGSIRAAATNLFLTEQGTRNRLVSLERTLGVSLYHKGRGRRTRTQLTKDGLRFLPAAKSYLNEAHELSSFFKSIEKETVIHVAASAYLAYYVLIDVVQKFHQKHEDFRVSLSTRSERDIEMALIEQKSVSIGIAAPYEASTILKYTHQFTMDWSLITPLNHPILKKKSVGLSDITQYPMIIFEHGSTGREHILEAFHSQSISPKIEMEATSTQLIVKMVEAGLGIAIVPLLKNGVVTNRMNVCVKPIVDKIRMIQSGILIRRNETLNEAEETFIQFLNKSMPK